MAALVAGLIAADLVFARGLFSGWSLLAPAAAYFWTGGWLERALSIDLAKPQYFSALAEWTKRGGYGVLEPGKPGITMLLWEDAAIRGLAEAEKGDVWMYTRETRTEATGVRISPTRRRRAPARLAVSAGKLPEGQAVSARRVHLRAPDAESLHVRTADGERLQPSGLHEQRLRGADAKHHGPAEEIQPARWRRGEALASAAG